MTPVPCHEVQMSRGVPRNTSWHLHVIWNTGQNFAPKWTCKPWPDPVHGLGRYFRSLSVGSLRAGPGPFIHGLKSGLRTRTNIITSADYASRSYWTLIKWVWHIRHNLHLKEEYQLFRRILSLLSRVKSHFMPAVMFCEAPRHRLWNISCEALYSRYTLIASNWNASHNRHFACIRI